ncbi:uncharacterized protein LOC132720319, partial [Ruditapes philippinarum]|uniref:uncharacterized protein LOC132720319 n=1 Tax=Ruditapes philippinarum TaxID=129788 RepID=UPI00295AD040
MSLSKRKSLDDNTDEPDLKKVKEFSDVEGTNGHQNCAVVDGTQEYDLEDSDGFEFDPQSTLKQDSLDSNGVIDGEDIAKLQREITEEYEADIDSKNGGGHENPSTTKISMEKIVSIQKDAELIKGIIPGSDIETIYDKIMKKRNVKNRVDVVTNDLLEDSENMNASAVSSVSDSSSDEGIFKEVAEVLIVRPNADPNRVYDLLDQLTDTEKRVEKVLGKLTSADDLPSRSGSETSASKSESSNVEKSDSFKGKDPFTDPEFRKNPLFNDLRTLRKVLPEKDPNEIYAFLEAHYDKANRVQIVIDELTKSESQESLSLPTADSSEDFDRGKAPLTAVDKFHADLNELKEIFRDCDPNYLYNKLESRSGETDRVQIIAADLFEHRNYPKLKDIKEKEEKEDLKDKIVNMKFDMKTFLKKFTNPMEYFQDTSRTLNQNYKDHVLVYMKNTYPFLKVGYIKKVLEQHNYHLSPTVKMVDQELQLIADRPSKKKRVTPRFEHLDYPENPDEPFFQEVMFCNHRQEIKDYIGEQTRVRNLKIEGARKNGELLECGCCFDDECLFEEMAACADGHIFCKECIRRSSEAAVGEGKTKFLCLT